MSRPSPVGTAMGAAIMAVLCAAPGRADPWPKDDFDLSGYVVTDRDASYFDVPARQKLLQTTDDPMLKAEVEAYGGALDCEAAQDIRTIDYYVFLPRYYEDHAGWRAAAEPFFAFENTISGLTAGFVATGDEAYADCALGLLREWAAHDAMVDFHYGEDNKQAWFEVEASAAAAGLAYSILRRTATPGERQAIEGWLKRLSRTHIAFDGGANSCCNNHYYRRSLHATAIGIATGDDELFRYGIRAAHRAIGELNPDGSFPREMERGDRVVHYQNFALLYLIPIFELAERQGYPLYDLAVDGKTVHDAVDRALDLLLDPSLARRYTDEEQDLFFYDDPEFFTWMELYNARFPSERMTRILDERRPTYSRRAGGPMTMYVYTPTDDGQS